MVLGLQDLPHIKKHDHADNMSEDRQTLYNT
jgi:hypothetical protein